jgi:hypothetical protein
MEGWKFQGFGAPKFNTELWSAERFFFMSTLKRLALNYGGWSFQRFKVQHQTLELWKVFFLFALQSLITEIKLLFFNGPFLLLDVPYFGTKVWSAKNIKLSALHSLLPSFGVPREKKNFWHSKVWCQTLEH